MALIKTPKYRFRLVYIKNNVTFEMPYTLNSLTEIKRILRYLDTGSNRSRLYLREVYYGVNNILSVSDVLVNDLLDNIKVTFYQLRIISPNEEEGQLFDFETKADLKRFITRLDAEQTDYQPEFEFYKCERYFDPENNYSTIFSRESLSREEVNNL